MYVYMDAPMLMAVSSSLWSIGGNVWQRTGDGQQIHEILQYNVVDFKYGWIDTHHEKKERKRYEERVRVSAIADIEWLGIARSATNQSSLSSSSS